MPQCFRLTVSCFQNQHRIKRKRCKCSRFFFVVELHRLVLLLSAPISVPEEVVDQSSRRHLSFLVPMLDWDDVHLIHLSLVPYLSPPDVVCLFSTSHGNLETFDRADAWKALAKTSFGSIVVPRKHRCRRRRKKKIAW